jgi:hypothetical protein
LQPPANTGISKKVNTHSHLIPLISFLGSSSPFSCPFDPPKLCAMIVRMQTDSCRRQALFAASTNHLGKMVRAAKLCRRQRLDFPGGRASIPRNPQGKVARTVVHKVLVS